MNRREFVQALAIAAAAGLRLTDAHADTFSYDVPRFGNVHLLHFTDCHAQLLPIEYREPSVNLGVAQWAGQPPHLVGHALLKRYGIAPGSRAAHAFTALDFTEAARRYGRMGGFAHLATLIKRLRATRPNALLLDGGDTWQGSATALWTNGQDMVDAALALGVDVMTPHWEMTYGADRVRHVVDHDFKNKVAFVAQNIQTADFGDPVFDPYVLRELNGVPVAIIGQAFPYTPIAHPADFTPDWTFGIQEERLQKMIDEARGKGAKVVVLLSHNGMDVDLKLASRVHGLDAILGGHTHDAVPAPVKVSNPGGVTLVTNAGANGKFVGVLDLDVRGGTVRDIRYTLLPVFADLLPPDPAMTALIDRVRAPYKDKLGETLATNRGLLYRRGNFNGTFDQLIVDGLMHAQGAEIAFSPGFRWGTTLLPGEALTMEALMAQTAITYPATTLTEMTGATIKTVLEDVADNLFNPDPYYQQGGDMVRTGGLRYTIDPTKPMGQRITDMRLGPGSGKPIDADRRYKVAGWAAVSPEARKAGGRPVWDVLADWLRDQREVTARPLNTPRIVGMEGNPGMENAG
ncbi:thiosulfohydrolase SoxB [Ralstonia sp. CHL-2022]|uniref:Thiosulfohydrolase SoxB n=2 Tax=Pseudomonadota TaxID=1224 RepID=A0AAE3L9P2_9RALS|nr:thiosulfohydrolase SoxB [Ralstonia mojiangensis]MCT7315244.1 thiosulfohydrolase SoxB [Ralstonia mojiangensis]